MTTAYPGVELEVPSRDGEFLPRPRRTLEARIVSPEVTSGGSAADRGAKPRIEVVLSRAHPEDRAAIQRLIARLAHEVEEWNLEHRPQVPRRSGKHLWVVANGQVQAFKDRPPSASGCEAIIGASPALRTVLSHVSQVAQTDSTVLITGETGTGKELVARAIHQRSPRSARALVAVNCAAMPPSLIASELFGHEKGAFTGAAQRRLGRFELASGGTIFLDEVGELPAETQIMLLRVLQEGEFERLGGGPVRANVRVIAATNRHLQAAVADGTFRADLFYRLNVFPLHVPALRERRADIPLLVEYFTQRYAKRVGKWIQGVTTEALALLRAYAWPGNIRELQNVIERAVIVCESDTLSIDARWLSGPAVGAAPVPGAAPGTLATHERDAIETALEHSKGRVAGPFGAATRLGVPASTLESKIKALKVDKRRFKTG